MSSTPAPFFKSPDAPIPSSAAKSPAPLGFGIVPAIRAGRSRFGKGKPLPGRFRFNGEIFAVRLGANKPKAEVVVAVRRSVAAPIGNPHVPALPAT